MAPRGLVPAALAIGFGILNGYVIFQPAYAEREAQKFKQAHEQSTSGGLGENADEATITTTQEVSRINAPTNPVSFNPNSPNTKPADITYTRSIYNWWTGRNEEGKTGK